MKRRWLGVFLLNSMQAYEFSLGDLSNPFVDFSRFNHWKNKMEERINSTYRLMVPSEEQRKWNLINDCVRLGNIDQWAEACWIPSNEEPCNWSEMVYCHFEYMPKNANGKKYESMLEVIEDYKTYLETSAIYRFEINVVCNKDKEAILDIDRYEKGVGGLTKKVSLAKCVERRILTQEWLIILQFELRSSEDAKRGSDKKDAWGRLRKTWLERFSRVQFKA